MLPRIGHMLYFQLDTPDEEEANKTYKSRITDEGDDYLTIDTPMSGGYYKRLYEGDQLNAHFFTEDGVKYYFHTSVRGMGGDAVPQVILVKPEPESITKVQRRSFLRVPGDLDVALDLGRTRFIARTNDVSGGGISFVCDSKYPIAEGAVMSGWLLVQYKDDSIRHVPFTGELVRVKEYDGEHLLGMMRFSKLRSRDREAVVRYCFERQIELRKK